MSFVAIACLTPSSQSPVRRAMQTISNAIPRTRCPSKSKRSPLRNGVIGMRALPWYRRERDGSLSHRRLAQCRCRWLVSLARCPHESDTGPGSFFLPRLEPITSWRVVAKECIWSPRVCGVSDLPKREGFACPRCKVLMDEMVRIAPLANEPGLIGYECPACRYVTSVVLQPMRR